MHVQFTNLDSTGTAATRSLTLTLDGERHTISVAKTGTATVPREVGEHLIDSDNYAVGPYEGDDADADADASTEVVADDSDDNSSDDSDSDSDE